MQSNAIAAFVRLAAECKMEKVLSVESSTCIYCSKKLGSVCRSGKL